MEALETLWNLLKHYSWSSDFLTRTGKRCITLSIDADSKPQADAAELLRREGIVRKHGSLYVREI